MQTPTLEQIKRWASGEDEPPNLDELQALAEIIGDRRVKARAAAEADSELLESLVPLMYIKGWRDVNDMHTKIKITRVYINKYLDNAGITKGTSRSKLLQATLSEINDAEQD